MLPSNNNNQPNIMSSTQRIYYTFPSRYSKIALDKVHDMLQDAELNGDYIKWKSGINYNTNRKIKIGGALHQHLSDKFMIQYPYEYVQGHSFGKNPVLFVDLADIDINSYLQENEKIITTIYALNSKLNNEIVSSL
jgi:hypothetical protein